MELISKTWFGNLPDVSERCCKFSGLRDLEIIMSLGNVPLADKLLFEHELDKEEYIVPLELAFSHGSKLVQITNIIPAACIYNEHYPYFSSVSPALLRHFSASADNLVNKLHLDSSSLVVEAASNDGYMLNNFHERNIPVLGIEPASKQAAAAIDKNIPTLNTFFTSKLAKKLVSENKPADLFLANNVLAHAEDLNDFVYGMSLILKPAGMAVIEVPYVVDLVNKCEFDTIYHQHIYYFSLMSLAGVFSKYNLYINDIEHLDIHGGSIRLYVQKIKNTGHSVHRFLHQEQELGLGNIDYYKDLDSRARILKQNLLKLLQSLKYENKSIAAYGAAGKAATFMSYMQIDNSIIDYVVDLSERKHGLYMGGNHLKIYPTDKLLTDRPDYTLILAWNFADEIIMQMDQYLKLGGKFIVPIPALKIV